MGLVWRIGGGSRRARGYFVEFMWIRHGADQEASAGTRRN